MAIGYSASHLCPVKTNTMLSKISWNQFITTILFLAWAYYTAIIVLFYRKDLLKWFAHGMPLNQPRSKPQAIATEEKINYAEVHELMEDLKTIFISSAKKKIIKQELILSIQNKLKGYQQLKGTEIENEIIGHIENECKEKCAIDLDKADLENLWIL
jgi:hypothetical protein